MNKPLIYLDSDVAILCLARSLRTAGFCEQAERLGGLTILDPESARYASRLIAELPPTCVIEEERRGALEMLAVAAHAATTMSVQAPIDLC